MANSDTKEKILEIRVNYDKAIQGLSEYMGKLEEVNAEEKKLRETIKESGKSTDEQRKQLAAIKATQDEYKSAIRDLNKEVQNNIKHEKEQDGSLRSLRAQLSNATKDFDSLSKAEREGAKGKALAKHINELTDELKEAEAETQRFYRNVGNYEESIKKAIAANVPFIGQIQSMIDVSGGASKAIKSLGSAVVNLSKTLLTLLANPVFAVLAGLAAIIMAIKTAINSSEEATNRWNVVLAPLGRAMDFLMNLLQKAVGYLLSFVEAGIKMYDWAMKLAEKLPIVGDKIKEINKANEEAIQLAKEKADIEKQARENEVLNAKDALRVAELRKEAKDRENATAEERLAAIKEANKLEEQAAKRNVELAERRYNALKLESERAENNAETNAELARLEADMYNARREYFSKTMELLEQENTVRGEIAAKAKEAAADVQARKQKELEAVRAAQDAIFALITSETERQLTQTETTYNRQIEDLKKRLETEKDLTVAAKRAINSQISALEDKKEIDLAQIRQQANKDEIQKEADKQAKLIELRLSALKEGSDEELALRIQQLELQKAEEIRAAEELGIARVEVEAKYNKLIEDERAKTAENLRNKAAEELALEWQNKINEAALHHEDTLQLEVEYRRSELEALHQMEGESDAEFKARQLEAEQNYVDAKKTLANKEMEIEQAKYEAAAAIAGSLSDVFSQLGEDNKAMATLSKVLALAEIAINTGKAISEMVAAESSKGLLGILTTAAGIARILAMMAQATSVVKSAKFAEGGLVTGPGSGTSDSIPARLSNGESVMTSRATEMFAPVLSAFNQIGGGVPISVQQSSSVIEGEEMLARAVAKGVAALPRPVVSVEEITTTANRVAVLEKLGDA
nr:MAG TPA: MAEBL protein [Caudoviricetes sp.]